MPSRSLPLPPCPPSRSENKKLRRAVTLLQEAEGRAEYRCRQALARLQEIEAAELELEAQVEAQSASKKAKDEEIAALQQQLGGLRCDLLCCCLLPDGCGMLAKALQGCCSLACPLAQLS
jgi:hypothetical protein